MSKVWKKTVLIFLYTLHKAQRKFEPLFSHLFLAVFSLISNATNFFIHPLNRFVLKKKNAYALLVFLNWVPYMQLSHMIPGVNIIGRKVSVASINRVGEERKGGLGVV